MTTSTEDNEIMAIIEAVAAIRRHAEAHHQSSGHIECPACKERLSYSIARSNGHVWGKCETPACLRWMM